MLTAKVAAIEEAGKHRDREIRDLKKGVSEVDKKLDEALAMLTLLEGLLAKVSKLTTYQDEQIGAFKLGRWLGGAGFFGLLGTAAYGIIEFFRSL